jgi:putative flavoprotein involved in K+ transport
MSQQLHTIVVGGGQAGLVMSHYLTQCGFEHLVFERARVAERWRSERWDSLYFQFPNRYLKLPGLAYDGDTPDGFMHRDGVVGFLERYAEFVRPPLHCGVNVSRVERDPHGGFKVHTPQTTYRAQNVVIATGPYQQPAIPVISAHLSPQVTQLAASQFTNAAALPAGGVLVVGAGGSGCQIAEDLLTQGRSTHLSVGSHRRIPRRYRNRDITDWLEELGILDTPSKDIPVDMRAPLLTGFNGGHDVDLRALRDQGLKLHGKLTGVDGQHLTFAGNLDQMLDASDAAYGGLIAMIDAHEAGRTVRRAVVTPPGAANGADTQLKLAVEGISSVVWATGYTFDFSWLPEEVLNENGNPFHWKGVSSVPGLYFLGLPGLNKVKSSVLWGVGEDAEHIAQVIRTSRADEC